MFESFAQEVFKDDAPITRLIRMLPACGARPVPILERFFEVKLDGIDELPVATLDHHLVAAEIGSGEESEAIGNVVELQPMILPDAKDARLGRVILPDAGSGIIDAREDRIFG